MSVATPLETWVDQAAKLTKPDRVVYCDGSEVEYQRMIAEMLQQGGSFTLNEKTFPNCHLHRSSPNDVARTEHLTFICSPEREEAGPTNNWMDPGTAKQKVGALLDGAMRGRTMYVVPYVMGPVSSPISKVGVEVTDSPYVVASMRIMSRMGKVAMERHDYAAARDWFAKEVARADYYHEFHYWLALAQFRLGDVEQARQHLARAMEYSTTRRDRDLYAAKLAWIRSRPQP